MLKQQVLDVLNRLGISESDLDWIDERGNGRIEVKMKARRTTAELIDRMEEAFDVIDYGNGAVSGWFIVGAKDPAACRRCDGMGSVGFDVRCPDCNGTGEAPAQAPLLNELEQQVLDTLSKFGIGRADVYAISTHEGLVHLVLGQGVDYALLEAFEIDFDVKNHDTTISGSARFMIGSKAQSPAAIALTLSRRQAEMIADALKNFALARDEDDILSPVLSALNEALSKAAE